MRLPAGGEWIRTFGSGRDRSTGGVGLLQLYLSRIAALRPPVGPCDRRSAVSSRSKHPIGGARSAFYGRIASLSRLALRKSDWQKIPMRKARQAVLELAGREVVITNPDKPFFPEAGHTKLHLVRYYAAVAEGALRGIAGRPIVLKRYVDGAAGEPFFQKRAPEQRPEWIETVELRFPSGRTAREIVVRDAAQLLWMVNLGCIDLNPHPVRADDLEHPDELRVDLDPGPGVSWDFVRRVTLLVRDVLDEHGLRGWPKTSGSRGMHVNVRIQRRWSFEQVRRAALALAREVERRAPDLASSKWWKEERRGVFLDYNQNAKDRTVASAWSVRPTPDARVSMPLEWDEVADCDPAAFTLATAPARFAERGDASAGIDSAAGSLDALLELSASQEAAGLGRRAVAAAL